MRLDNQIIEVKLSDFNLNWSTYPEYINNLNELKNFYCTKELNYGKNFTFFDAYEYYSELLIGEYLRTSEMFSLLNNKLFCLKMKLDSINDRIYFCFEDCSEKDMLFNSGRENLYRLPLFQYLQYLNVKNVNIHYDNQIINSDIMNAKNVRWNQYVTM